MRFDRVERWIAFLASVLVLFLVLLLLAGCSAEYAGPRLLARMPLASLDAEARNETPIATTSAADLEAIRKRNLQTCQLLPVRVQVQCLVIHL